MVSKTLKLLAQHGLLVSQRGVQGGYQLARRPEAISLAEVIHALEEGVAMTECLWAPGDCEQEPTCRVRRNWHRINQVVQGALETISLLDMTHPLPEHLIPLTRISLSN
jgi:Rrf2 family protein